MLSFDTGGNCHGEMSKWLVAGATVDLEIGGSGSRDETTDKRPSAKKHHRTQTQATDDSQNRTITSDTQESTSSLLCQQVQTQQHRPNKCC
jgi:hypothetical protein